MSIREKTSVTSRPYYYNYGCESWTLNKHTHPQYTYEATEMWFLRIIMKVSWTKKKEQRGNI